MGHLIIKIFHYHIKHFGRFVIVPLENICWNKQSKSVNVKEAKL